jgi:hypothetical protein
MRRILGLIVAGGLWLGTAAPADAQFSLSIGNPYMGGYGIGNSYLGGYGLPGYGVGTTTYSNGFAGYPGTFTYSSGYNGVYPGGFTSGYYGAYPRTYSSGYYGVYPGVGAVAPMYGYRSYGYSPYSYGYRSYGGFGGLGRGWMGGRYGGLFR